DVPLHESKKARALHKQRRCFRQTVPVTCEKSHDILRVGMRELAAVITPPVAKERPIQLVPCRRPERSRRDLPYIGDRAHRLPLARSEHEQSTKEKHRPHSLTRSAVGGSEAASCRRREA